MIARITDGDGSVVEWDAPSTGPPPAGPDPSAPAADGYYIDRFDPAIVPKDDNADGKLDDIKFAIPGKPDMFARPEAPFAGPCQCGRA